jgi:hypothetical protein
VLSILRKLKKLFVATLIVIISLVVADIMLHGLASVSPRVNEVVSILSAKIPDDRLGHRPNPAYPGHDAKGFRNPQVPGTAHVVALGDSHTYGSGVKSEQAWPRVLESLLGHPVYNMGLGGYGPVHSLLLWDEAAVLKPAVVIEAIYAGNDLHDSFKMVYKRGQLPELKTIDKNLQDVITQAEVSDSIGTRVSKMYRRGETKSKTRLKIKAWLDEHSKIYGLLRRTQYELSQYRKKEGQASRSAEDKWKKAQSFAAKHSEYAQAFSSDNARTVFTSEYRLAALNLDDHRIREGQRISLEAIRQMHQLAQRDGIRFIVLLIPTKEFVFAEQAAGIDAPNYHILVRNERQFWDETISFLQQHTIEYIDALPSLRLELETGPQPYKMSHDGHPNEHGQHAIAATVHSYLGPQ